MGQNAAKRSSRRVHAIFAGTGLALLLTLGAETLPAQQAPTPSAPAPCLGYSYNSRRSFWIPADIHRVIGVQPGSPAEAAGLREGDVLLTTGGVRIGTSAPPLVPGDTTELRIERQGRELVLRVAVGERVPAETGRPNELICRPARRSSQSGSR